LPLLAVLVSAAACSAAAQPTTAEAAPDNTPGVGIKVSFRPSVAIVVGIFTMIFSLTFLLLMYAKFCHPSSSPLPTASRAAVPGGIIFVERVPSARFAGGGGAGPKQADDHEETSSARAPSSPEQLDRHKHRIIVSDVVFKSRWSELNSADLIALDTEMLRSMSSGRFSLPDSPEYNEANQLSTAAAAAEEEVDGVVPTARGETERKRLLVDGRGGGRCSSSAAVDAVPAAARMITSGVRSMSEIVSLPRLRGAARERLSEEENRRWLPIARRTARWFAGRARGEEAEAEAVHVVAARV
ncbi:hypothetical protein BAE44_0014087, partial [Dichanthelium oligosanthes]